MALTDKLTAIANAIRSKTGETGKMTLDQMPIKIGGIETGPSIDLDGITAVESDVLSTASFMTREGSIMQGAMLERHSDGIQISENGSEIIVSLAEGYYPNGTQMTYTVPSSGGDGVVTNFINTTWNSTEFRSALIGMQPCMSIATELFSYPVWPIGIGFTINNDILPVVFGTAYADFTKNFFAFRGSAGISNAGDDANFSIVLEIDVESGELVVSKLEINGVEWKTSVTNTTPVRIFTFGY